MLGEPSGLLLLDKPGLGDPPVFPEQPDRLPTSHDAVQRVRRRFGLRRVGHTGTLDPFASGLLVICLGRATRLAEYYQGQPKTYRAVFRFGLRTDTDDITGTALEEVSASAVTDARLAALVPQFTGWIDQIPPAFSAKRIDGQRAHRIARAGGMAALQPQTVHVAALEALSSVQDGCCEFMVTCSAGTYIRSLARDMGQALGVGGTVASLRRVSLGALRVADAVPLAKLEADAPLPELADAGSGLAWPRLVCDADMRLRFGQGREVEAPDVPIQLWEGGMALAVDAECRTLGVVLCTQAAGARPTRFRARKWLAAV